MPKSVGIFLIVILLLGGCALAFYARCLDTAIYQAQTFEDKGYEVRIAYGRVPNGKPHVQAQAKINGEWEWLQNNTLIMVGRKDNFIVEENLSLKEAKRRWRQGS